MNRRGFFGLLAALPCFGWLKPKSPGPAGTVTSTLYPGDEIDVKGEDEDTAWLDDTFAEDFIDYYAVPCDEMLLSNSTEGYRCEDRNYLSELPMRMRVWYDSDQEISNIEYLPVE